MFKSLSLSCETFTFATSHTWWGYFYQTLYNDSIPNKGGGKVGLLLWVCKQSLFLYYYLLFCIVFPMNNCKPTFAPPCIWWWWWCQCPQTFQLWTIFLLKFQTFISICTQLSWALKMDVYKIQILIFFPNQVLDSLFHSVNGNSILPVIREEK